MTARTAASQTPAPDSISWWWQDAMARFGSEPDCPPLAGGQTVDVAIVGGGFTGLWTALALKQRQPSLTIALIESRQCGSGASGKNGGKVHGYWASLTGMARSMGDDAALAVARAGTRAQDGIRAFATQPGRDVWWRDGGSMRVSTAPAHDAKIDGYIRSAQRLGAADTAVRLTPAEVQARCGSPAFRAGLFFSEGATVHPARLARALRSAVLASGVTIFENTPMVGLDRGAPNRVRTPAGELLARDVVLATNTALATEPSVRPHLCIFSSFALMTDVAAPQLDAMGWRNDEGLSDLRMFLHYFRKTPDGRVLMGSGSGPISYTGRANDPRMVDDQASADRAEAGLRRLLPALASVPVVKTWGGAIDVSADRLPFFRTVPGTRIHTGCGYSGHGVNATYIGGQCLASLVLDMKDDWSSLPLCTRQVPTLPPEPWRTLGGRAVRWGILNSEEAEEQERRASLPAQALAALPRLFGLKIGTR